jgi:hypothetical protein
MLRIGQAYSGHGPQMENALTYVPVCVGPNTLIDTAGNAV